MKKIELIKALSEKGITEKEFEETFITKQEEMKKRGIIPENIDDFALHATRLYFRKVLSSRAKSFEGVLLGRTRVSDFGAQKLYDDARKKFSEDADAAIEEGICLPDGTPIYTTPEWKRGRKIIPEQAKGRDIIMLCKQPQDNNVRIGILHLGVENIKREIPFCTPVKFVANVQEKSNEKFYFLTMSNMTKFEITNEKINVEELIKKNLWDYFIEIQDFSDWIDSANHDVEWVLTKANVVDIEINPSFEFNSVKLETENMQFDGEKVETFTARFPKDLSINFSPQSFDLYMIGRPWRRKETSEIGFEVFGFYIDEMWINKQKLMPIEETVESV